MDKTKEEESVHSGNLISRLIGKSAYLYYSCNSTSCKLKTDILLAMENEILLWSPEILQFQKQEIDDSITIIILTF